MRGSIESEALERLPCDGDCPSVLSERPRRTAMNTLKAFVSVGEFRISLNLELDLLVRPLATLRPLE